MNDLEAINFKLPKEVNWVNEGVIGGIKNQYKCASGWAFGVIGAIESHYAIKTGQLLELSEQNLIDCTFGNPYKNLGCSGGSIYSAFNYVINSSGINEEITYPYERHVRIHKKKIT